MSTQINLSSSTPTHSRQASYSNPLVISPKKPLPLTTAQLNTSDSQKNTPSKMPKSVNSAFSQLTSPDDRQTSTNDRQGSQEFDPANFSDASRSVPSLPFSQAAALASFFPQQAAQLGQRVVEERKLAGIVEFLPKLRSTLIDLDDDSFSSTNNAIYSALASAENQNDDDFDKKSKSLDTNFNAGKFRQTAVEERELAHFIDLDDDTLSSPNDAISSVLASTENQYDDYENPANQTPWTQFHKNNQRGLSNPSRGNRDRDSAALSTPPIASRKNKSNSLTPSKSKEASPSRGTETVSATELPFTDSSNSHRWYRRRTSLLPGIIIDPHQSKHTPGLCGPHKGGSGTTFQEIDWSPTRQRQILDELMNNEACAHFDSRPENPFPGEISVPWNGTYVRFSGQVYNSDDDCWYIHYFPVYPKK